MDVRKLIREEISKLLEGDLLKKTINSKLGKFEDLDWKSIHQKLIIIPNLNKNTTFDDMVFRNLMHGNRPTSQELKIFDHLWSNIPNIYDDKYKKIEPFKEIAEKIWKKEYKTNISEAKSKFEKLKDNKVPLTPEEREKVMDADAVWHFSPGNKPSPAVWKSEDKSGKITYVTHTHRAYNTAPTLKGAISRYHKFIKGTA